MEITEARRLGAEFLGTALLLAAVVGSGITAETDGAASAQLFQHAVVVGTALVALILTFGPVSGAHLNPSVTAADWWFGGLPTPRALRYVTVQVAGAFTGTVATNLMFGHEAVRIASTAREGTGLAAGEAVATGGLLVVIFALVRTERTSLVAGAVGAWIGAAIYFTASASFANPAVTLARMVTDTYTGIIPSSVPGFLVGQGAGTVAATALIAWMYRPSAEDAHRVVVPHDEPGLSTATDTSFVPLLAERFARDRLRAAARMEGLVTTTTPTVLFLCVHNAGRSQMAAGWLQHLAGDRVEVLSGGSEPASQINPAAVAAMREEGIDITEHHPKPWTEETVGAADVVVTMGCGDACPVIPGKRYLDWELEDPAGSDLEGVRAIRDEIERRVRGLMDDLGVEPTG